MCAHGVNKRGSVGEGLGTFGVGGVPSLCGFLLMRAGFVDAGG